MSVNFLFFKPVLFFVTLFLTCFLGNANAVENNQINADILSKLNTTNSFQTEGNLPSDLNTMYYDCKSVYDCENYYIPLQCTGSPLQRVICQRGVKENCRRYYGVPPNQC